MFLKDGTIEIWQMVENVMTEWRCVVRTNQFPAEMFIKARFIPRRRKVRMNSIYDALLGHPSIEI